MKVLVLLALVVCAVAAMPYLEDEKELVRRMVDFDGSILVHKILDPLMTLVSKESTEHDCETACKAGIHTVFNYPQAELVCAPACKEMQHRGMIQG